MKPGRELDKLVAEVMGWKRIDDCPLGDSFCPGKYLTPEGERRCCLPFSTEAAPAMQAFEWLEKNSPWKPKSLMLGRGWLWGDDNYRREYFTVFLSSSMWYADEFESLDLTPLSKGETYAHVIALAVLEAKEEMARK